MTGSGAPSGDDTTSESDAPERDRDAPDLDAVEELCRLALNARRLGCRVQFLDVDPALRDLLCLAGVGEMVATEVDGGAQRPNEGSVLS